MNGQVKLLFAYSVCARKIYTSALRPQESFFELHALCPKGELWVSTYEIGYCTTMYEMDSTMAVVIVSAKWKGQEGESVQKRGSRECMYAIVPGEQDMI